jgi:hypothetical protein
MSSRSGIKPAAVLALFGIAAFGLMLTGCSDIYTDRRETVALGAGDAMAANRVTHTIDPWSPAPQHRLQRREDAERTRALSHRAGHPAGQRNHLVVLFAGPGGGAAGVQQPIGGTRQ